MPANAWCAALPLESGAFRGAKRRWMQIQSQVKGCRNGAKIWRHLQATGFQGSLPVVAEWATQRYAEMSNVE